MGAGGHHVGEKLGEMGLFKLKEMGQGSLSGLFRLSTTTVLQRRESQMLSETHSERVRGNSLSFTE